MLTTKIQAFVAAQKTKTHPFTTLSFANFMGRIESHPNETIDNLELVRALKTCPEIDLVDISGHCEVTNLIFSRFRKYLPKLEFIVLGNILPSDCEITADQLAKYYVKGIKIIADHALMEHFQKLMVEYFANNGQQDYAQQIQQREIFCTLDTKKVETAILFEENKRKELVAKQHQQYLEESKTNQAALQQLFADYKNGIGFDVHSKWFRKGPQESAQTTAANEHLNDCFSEASRALYLVITQLNLWPVVEKGPGSMGFMFSSPKALDAVYTHRAILAGGHSGASLSFSMRLMEQIAKAGSFQDYVEQITPSQARLKR